MNGLSSAFPSFRSAIQTSPSDHRRHLAASPGPGRTLSSSPPLLTTGNCVLPRTFSHWTAGRQQTEGGRWQAGVRRAGRGMVHSDDITEEQRTSLGDTEAHWGKRWLLLGSGCFLEFSKGPMGLAGSQHFIVHEQATEASSIYAVWRCVKAGVRPATGLKQSILAPCASPHPLQGLPSRSP